MTEHPARAAAARITDAQLRVLVAVADTGGFTEAARRLGLTQSAVSHAITTLERRLGVTLVERTARDVRLTGAGARALAHARELLRLEEALVRDAEGARRRHRARLRIASFGPTASRRLLPPLLDRFAAREGRFEDEGWRLRKDGTRFWANVVITALRNSAGELVGFTKVTRDLTERRAAEEQRVADAKRVAAAEAANRAKAEFLASLSHELRTPLNAIGGYAELLAEGLYGTVSEAQREVLERIRRSQQHLLSIITDLLNYSRLEAGRITYDIAPVAVAAMLDTVGAMIQPQALRKALTFERGPCPSQVVVRTDRARTEQILLNLLSDAVKFTPAGGRIIVSCTSLGERVAVRVRDTGPGIPPDKLEAIFEPFVQLGRTLNSAHEGAGLGLAISRDLARAMGGDLTAASAPGSGATFTLLLPAA
ncbi:MAG TPA: ATP-binding protein [Gemmatimonadaceae bacterium]